MRKVLYTILALIVLLLVAVGVGCYLLTTDRVQQWLFREGLEQLSEKLDTRVSADSISVKPLDGHVALYGFSIDDRTKTEMLRVDTLYANIDVHALLDRELLVDKIVLSSAKAVIYKERKDTAANYQFVIDAFKKKKSDKPKTDKKKNKLKLRLDIEDVEVTNMRMKWDIRNLPRKNTNKPRHGAFDANHLDATVSLLASMRTMGNDSTYVNLKSLCLYDHGSKLDIRHMTSRCHFSKRYLSLTDTRIRLPHTDIRMDTVRAELTKADTKPKTRIRILQPFCLEASVLLQDIAKPFAPVLDKFTTPLQLKVNVSGELTNLTFSNIHIITSDGRLRLTANGDMKNVGMSKEKLALHFRNISLSANSGVKEQIIRHFAHHIRMKMVRQMKAVGDVRFRGYLDVLYRREKIGGTIITKFGNVSTDFLLNSDTHLMTGTLRTDSLDIGKLMEVEKLGPVRCSGKFSFDISSKKKRKPIIERGGKSYGRLPIGSLDVEIHKAKYGILRVKEVDAKVVSNGTTATGTIILPKRLFDIVTDFTYTQTDSTQAYTIHPSLKKPSRHKTDETDEKPKTSIFKKLKNLFRKNR